SRRDLPRRPIAWRPRSVDPVLRDSRAATLPYTPPTQVDDGRDVPLLHDRVARPTRHPRYQDAGRAGRQRSLPVRLLARHRDRPTEEQCIETISAQSSRPGSRTLSAPTGTSPYATTYTPNTNEPAYSPSPRSRGASRKKSSEPAPRPSPTSPSGHAPQRNAYSRIPSSPSSSTPTQCSGSTRSTERTDRAPAFSSSCSGCSRNVVGGGWPPTGHPARMPAK